MHFSVLGPLRVDHDGTDLTPTAQKLRTVLALLLLSPGQVLPSVHILEELWGGDLPASARNTLQSYMVHLRRCLAVDESTGIQTESWGYRLAVDRELIDITVFRRHVDAARRQRARGDQGRARRELSSALRLWRDRPLVNVTLGPMLEVSYAYLQELYLSAVEQRIELDLEIGRHHDLLGELTLLSGRFPLNENLRAKMMIALYRSGRRYAALETYDHLRRALADEMGLEPCPAIRWLHRAVLACDPALDHRAESTFPALNLLSA